MKRLHGLVLLAVAAAVPARAENPEETKAFVPELSAFHEIIHPLWHEAWPSKDTTAVRALWPEVQKHVAAVAGAELPGILRDKKEAWALGLKRLEGAEAAYGAALDGGTLEAKLAAVEELHASFEGLVRTIRPPLKELAAFHEVLYRVYHYDLPNEDRKALVERLPALAQTQAALDAAVLPDHRADRKEAFEAARGKLSRKIDALRALAPGDGEWAAIAEAIEEMHSAYVGVEQVFE
jgi:hypothetical protein